MRSSTMCRLILWFTKTLCAATVITTITGLQIQAFAQDLYVLTATPTPYSALRFGSSLYRLNTIGGGLEKVREVVSEDNGVDLIEADYDRRLIVLGYPTFVSLTFAIVNMDAAGTALSVKIQIPTNSVVAGHYLVDMPGQGIMQALTIGESPVDAQGRPINVTRPDRLVGVSLAGASKKQEDLSWNDILYVHCEGYYGTGAGSNDSLRVRAGSDGTFVRIGSTETLGIPLPPHLSPPPGKYEDFKLWVNNNEMAVVSRGDGDNRKLYEANGFHVFSKDSSTWQYVASPVGPSLIRNFGYWIAGAAAQLDHQHLHESPGKEKRMGGHLRPAAGRRLAENVSVDEIFEKGNTYFPGELFLYNAKTGKSYTISTGQGDSEVVLATDSAVYYRVNDTLYRASVGADSLGKPERLAQDPLIFQVHWAFLSATR